MTKRIYILFIFFILSLTVYSAKAGNYQWQKTSLNVNSEIILVSGESVYNFWVQTISGTLLNVIDKKIIEYKVPSEIKLNYLRYFHISDNEFFCVGTTIDWKGEIYYIKNGEWSKYDVEIPYPLKSIVKLNNQYFVLGDFGTLLKYSATKWEFISTPYKSHTINNIVDKDNLIISTRSDGVFKFDGTNFYKIYSKTKFEFLYNIEKVGNLLYLQGVDNQLFYLNKDSLILADDKKLLNHFITDESNLFGFNSKLITQNDTIKHIHYPQNFNVNTYHVFDDGTIVLFSLDGNLFKSIQVSNIYFIDLASTYKVDDLPISENLFSHFFDANNDGIDDLLLINKTPGNYLSLFQGVNNSSFANITSISNLPANQFQILTSTISDVNKDGLNDIVLTARPNDKIQIMIYLNKSNFKFELSSIYNLLADMQLGARSTSSFDYDSDGDEDIIITSYYGLKDSPGFISILRNELWGYFDYFDTTLIHKTKHWNEKTIFADLNNDDLIDIFVGNSWSQDNIFIGNGVTFNEETDLRFPNKLKTENVDVRLSDFDNDSDLDIFTVSKGDFIKVFENNGQGYFSDKTNKLFNSKYFNRDIRYSYNLNIGDFNNDCFVDILVSINYLDSTESLLFINKNGRSFEQLDCPFEYSNTFMSRASISDVDKDGDLDIYATTNKHNYLWINSLNNKNSITLKLNGIESAPNALGSKIWIYKKDSLNISEALIGYKQLGTENIGKNSTNSFNTHFGLGENTECDIKVKFLSGKEITLKAISAGSHITINENGSFKSFFYQLPATIFRFLINTQNQIYIAVIFLSHLVLLFGLWVGVNKLNWSSNLRLVFATMNISLFWISLYFASFSIILVIRYLIPIILTLLVTFIPLILFYWINKNRNKDHMDLNDKLLNLVMLFSHGEWALRNLNSILLLCENAPSNWKTNEDFMLKLKTRLNTFSELTSASLKEIVELDNLSENKSPELNFINNSIEEVELEITDISSLSSLKNIIGNLKIIRKYTKDVRNNIYTRFSCNPTEVINSISQNFIPSIENENIILEKTKKYAEDIPVLIKNYELGNILDNLFQNSIRYMNDLENKNISISLQKDSPKIILIFSNTGVAINENKWEIIFEQGYSEGGSTGQGLYNSREILKKYGGRIYVGESNKDKTSFVIELNEGIINKNN